MDRQRKSASTRLTEIAVKETPTVALRNYYTALKELEPERLENRSDMETLSVSGSVLRDQP